MSPAAVIDKLFNYLHFVNKKDVHYLDYCTIEYCRRKEEAALTDSFRKGLSGLHIRRDVPIYADKILS